jgi:hypothetical protein
MALCCGLRILGIRRQRRAGVGLAVATFILFTALGELPPVLAFLDDAAWIFSGLAYFSVP